MGVRPNTEKFKIPTNRSPNSSNYRLRSIIKKQTPAEIIRPRGEMKKRSLYLHFQLNQDPIQLPTSESQPPTATEDGVARPEEERERGELKALRFRSPVQLPEKKEEDRAGIRRGRAHWSIFAPSSTKGPHWMPPVGPDRGDQSAEPVGDPLWGFRGLR